jgi:hypothetical protein
MYINLRHRPLGHENTTLHNTPYITLCLLLPTAYMTSLLKPLAGTDCCLITWQNYEIALVKLV